MNFSLLTTQEIFVLIMLTCPETQQMVEHIGRASEEQAAKIDILCKQLQTHEGKPVLVVRREWRGIGGFGFGPTSGYDVFEEGFCLAIATPPFIVVGEKNLLTIPTPQFALIERRNKRDRLSLEDGPVNRLFRLLGLYGSPIPLADLEVPIATRRHWSWRRFSLDSIPQLALEIVPGDQAIADWLQGLPQGGIRDDMLLVLHKLRRTLGRKAALPETLTNRTERLLEKRAIEILANLKKQQSHLRRVSEAKSEIRRDIQEDIDEAVALGLHEDPRTVARKGSFPLNVPQVVTSYANSFGVPLPESDTSPV